MHRDKKKPLPAKPFFTRFLEQQELRKIDGGTIDSTDKFPSDNDESETV